MLVTFGALLLAAAGAPASQAVESCAVMASHPDDPGRIAPGLEREEIDLPAALDACRQASAEPPFDARTAYHLGRLLFYAGDAAAAMPQLEASAEAGYPQAIFVLGYLLSLGEASEADLCRAGDYWTRAVALGHPWSAYHLVEKSLDGKLAGCPAAPGAAQLERYMDLARSRITVAASEGRVEALAARLAGSTASGGDPS